MADNKKPNDPKITRLARVIATACIVNSETAKRILEKEAANAQYRQEELRAAVKQCEDSFKQYRENVIKKFGEG